jgi:hypothetical protein
MAARLGFNWEEAVFGSVTAAYRHQYPDMQEHLLVTLPRIAFGEPIPDVISGDSNERAKKS